MLPSTPVYKHRQCQCKTNQLQTKHLMLNIEINKIPGQPQQLYDHSNQVPIEIDKIHLDSLYQLYRTQYHQWEHLERK